MADEKSTSPVPTPPASLKKDTLSEPAVEDKKFAVVEDEIAPEVEPIVVEEVAPSVVGAVVEVFADKIIFHNKKAKKSMSVWQVQRRLNDLGYTAVRKEKAGYYGDITQAVVDAYRAENKLGAGQIDEKFLKALFAGDKSVKLILS